MQELCAILNDGKQTKGEKMKRHIKKELLATVEMLGKMNDSILGVMVTDPQGVTEALIQCQESAAFMGNYVEAIETESTKVVQLLEEYCETLYQISVMLPDVMRCRKLVKKVRKELTALSNLIKYEIPDGRKEIVFLPYKAAMWDSLESVWEAARRDEGCEAYVMPIPYYEKNPDGSLGELHDEQRNYPEYVPVLDWKEHDIAAWKPDIAYIHNPYDQYNYVTSIHPDFYAKRLCQFVEKLIYIPYFVHQNDVVAEHYCVLPGTIYSNVVVLQSEKVRMRYMEEYRKATGIREGLEKKFVAYGSPKLDFRIRGGREDGLPEDWKRAIYKNGRRKKVIFLNTHLNMLMALYCEDFFKKLETIFETFRRNQDVVLLWRPHPLSRETVKSMNPEAVERYGKIVQDYKEEELGIYDISSDLYRAVDVSDAYYGNRSSVTELFKAAGKPVMIMNHKLHGGGHGNISADK